MKNVVILVAAAGIAGAANANIEAEILDARNFAGSRVIDINGNVLSGATRTETVFSNTASPDLRAFSSGDLEAVFGDNLSLTGTGTLEQFSFTLFNSTAGGANANPITSATVDVSFFRASDSSLIGSIGINTGTIDLAAGSFTTLTVPGLEGLGVNLDTTEVIVLQSIRSGTLVGGSTRAGIVGRSPVAVGSSVDQLYIEAADVNGGTAGFYNITSGGVASPFNVGYEVVVPAPGAAALLGLGGLVATRRRRA